MMSHGNDMNTKRLLDQNLEIDFERNLYIFQSCKVVNSTYSVSQLNVLHGNRNKPIFFSSSQQKRPAGISQFCLSSSQISYKRLENWPITISTQNIWHLFLLPWFTVYTGQKPWQGQTQTSMDNDYNWMVSRGLSYKEAWNQICHKWLKLC